MRFDLSGEHGELLADTGGRPLGISVGAKGVFVADANCGLLQIADGGAVKVLSRGADGIRCASSTTSTSPPPIPVSTSATPRRASATGR